ncbi:MAG: sigma-70 family RNA polymerase sigma factor [Catenulispora sp.]|nr:sigma-70 family RNA polymerase sigma factor [Catenulispora sp.]
MTAARREVPGAAPQRPAAEPPRVLPTAAYPGWEAIYADNVERIYRLMYTKVGNRHDAEDLTSQVFLTALGPLRTTASVGEVRSYLLTTARTVLASHWRSTLGHQVTVIDVDAVDLEDCTPGAEDEPAGRTAERLGAILSGLPERQRAILTLRFLRGYSIKAAAAELGVTVANAKVLQHRALRRAAGLDKEGEAS